ncbi:ABC transporter permease [Algibacillus agarilyticus]|uniref:ABC transporter permease n=1 Tax=Algibacillus agarilyticus TaxID=2234133 RepID=UPI000DD082EC|nr:iron ABC transporter permease [Algibacillus agarilyticus]
MLLSGLVAFVLILPVVFLTIASFQPDDDIFSHLIDTVLSDYVINTLLLVFGVCSLSLLIGLPLAWVMAMCSFPGKRFFSWALILPLAMPAYVVAYVFTDLFDYAGSVQITLRAWFNWQSVADYWFFDIRTLGGATIILSLVLYPYVYLLLRSAFINQCAVQVQASRIMGDSAWRSFFRISLPQTRGVIVAALSLVAMETMADFATVHYFAVNTLTTAIYDTWLGYYSLSAAAKLSVMMLAFVFIFLALEKYQRKRIKNYSRSDSFTQGEPYPLTGLTALLVVAGMSFIFFMGFVLPFGILIQYGIDYFDVAWNDDFIKFAWQSLLMASSVAVGCLLVALLCNIANRQQHETPFSALPGHAMSLGYALPGTVLAIAVLIPLTQIELVANEYLDNWFAWQPGLFLSGTLTAIIFAYIVRFSAITVGAIREGYASISPNLDNASLTMGRSFLFTVKRIHLPLLFKVMLTSSLLVFIEAMKELPAALLLRPFGFETLATYVYQYVSDEQLEHASIAAIAIVLVGLIPLIFVNRFASQSQR